MREGSWKGERPGQIFAGPADPVDCGVQRPGRPGKIFRMSEALEKRPVSSSALQSWLQQGEQLYAAALNEFRALEAQLEELEAKLAEKQVEVNKIAQMIGKPPVEGNRRLSAELVSGQIIEDLPAPRSPTSSSNATIARALTGKFGR